jgi:hypothetical protein
MTKMLPGRTARGAPEFDGKALSLKRYWEDVEEVAESCEKTTDAEKIKVAFRYIDREDELLWNGSITAGASGHVDRIQNEDPRIVPRLRRP